ncbi:MAG: DUF58 domain-containing protein [Chloroflexota bacterium]|nr:DUF58 domain-containing protein [Lentimicrobium sp.]
MIETTRFEELLPLELLAHQVVEGFITGLHKSPFHGFSVEFAENRLYNQGESVKHIDWKLYGRTDRLYVKRFEEETNLRCQLVIDGSSSMYYPLTEKPSLEKLDKMTFSVYAAAAIIQLLYKQRDASGLSIFTDDVKVHTEAHSNMVHRKFLFTRLSELIDNVKDKTGKATRAAGALHQIADNIHKRSLVIIFSDMFDNTFDSDLFSALQHLKHNKHEVILFHVTDKKAELDFAFENKPYKFIDLESGEEIKIRPQEIRESYVNRVEEFKSELVKRCAQYRIEFVEADINLGFKQILLPFLLKRMKML